MTCSFKKEVAVKGGASVHLKTGFDRIPENSFFLFASCWRALENPVGFPFAVSLAPRFSIFKNFSNGYFERISNYES